MYVYSIFKKIIINKYKIILIIYDIIQYRLNNLHLNFISCFKNLYYLYNHYFLKTNNLINKLLYIY